jgi:hypothetical protein
MDRALLFESFLLTSHLDKILITAPKLSALTFIKPVIHSARAGPSAFLPALPLMEGNFEYMIYLAGEQLRGGPPFQRAGWE